MRIKVKYLKLLPILLIISTSSTLAIAGWFGPNSSDKAKVNVALSQGDCRSGACPFKIKNNSEYTVHKVNFKVYGQIPGRSTIYDLNYDYTEFNSDEILSPGQTTEGYWRINQARWPEGEDLIISIRIESVIFKVNDSTETVY